MSDRYTEEQYVEVARENHNEDGVIEIDKDAEVSIGEDGAWVKAWVRVDNSEVENADH